LSIPSGLHCTSSAQHFFVHQIFIDPLSFEDKERWNKSAIGTHTLNDWDPLFLAGVRPVAGSRHTGIDHNMTALFNAPAKARLIHVVYVADFNQGKN
jgi:hypothetical protein